MNGLKCIYGTCNVEMVRGKELTTSELEEAKQASTVGNHGLSLFEFVPLCRTKLGIQARCNGRRCFSASS